LQQHHSLTLLLLYSIHRKSTAPDSDGDQEEEAGPGPASSSDPNDGPDEDPDDDAYELDDEDEVMNSDSDSDSDSDDDSYDDSDDSDDGDDGPPGLYEGEEGDDSDDDDGPPPLAGGPRQRNWRPKEIVKVLKDWDRLDGSRNISKFVRYVRKTYQRPKFQRATIKKWVATRSTLRHTFTD
jgi:hypothetical protein